MKELLNKGFIAEISTEEIRDFLLHNTGERSYNDDYIEVTKFEDCKRVSLYQKNKVGVRVDICAVEVYEHGLFVVVPPNDAFGYDALQKELYRYFISTRGPKFAEKFKSRMKKRLIAEATETNMALDSFYSSMEKCGIEKSKEMKKINSTIKENVASALVELTGTLDEVLQEVEQQEKSL